MLLLFVATMFLVTFGMHYNVAVFSIKPVWGFRCWDNCFLLDWATGESVALDPRYRGHFINEKSLISI